MAAELAPVRSVTQLPRQWPPGIRFDVIGAEQLVRPSSQRNRARLTAWHNLTLNAEEVIVKTYGSRIPCGNDARQERGLRVAGSPTREIAHGLRANALARVRRGRDKTVRRRSDYKQ